MKCKPYSEITVEIRTQLKTVKITSNIFAVRAISYRELSRIMAQAALPDRAVIFSNTIFTL